MALKTNELLSSATRLAALRLYPAEDGVKVKTFAAKAGADNLLKGTPVAFDDAAGFWQVYDQGSSEVSSITSDPTPATAGDFTLTVEGETTAAIAFDATAAAVQAALEALGAVDLGDVSAAGSGGGSDLGDASHVVTLTWQGKLANKALAVTADFSGLTGNVHVLAEVNAGVDSDGTDTIRGFVWPDEVQLDASEEVQGQVLIAGAVHRDDVNTAAIRALLEGSPSEANLDSALADGSPSLRELNIMVDGLASVK